jgi:hypothetical protein
VTAHDVLTLEQIRTLTGHEQTDAVRMALRRAGVQAAGFTRSGEGDWPPRKIYPADAVWHVFSSRILTNITVDPTVRDFCWEVFGRLIKTTISADTARTVFAERLD